MQTYRKTKKERLENMTAKEYLNQIKDLEVRIKNKNRDLEQLKEMAISLGGFDYKERVQTTKETGDVIGESIARLVDLENEISKDIIKLMELKQKISNTIDKVKKTECYEVLYQRYILCRKFEEIAFDMKYDTRQIHRFHGEGLKEIENVIECH